MVPNEQVPHGIDAHLQTAILEARRFNNVSQAPLKAAPWVNNHGLSQEIEDDTNEANESKTQMINTTNIPIKTRNL